MDGSEREFDPKLIQARWVIGGISPEELVEYAGCALGQGYDGSALQQLAGLVKPTLRELGTLPQRAFANMGLFAMSEDEATAYVISCGERPISGTVAALLEAFPRFSERWRKHIASWGGKPAGSYNDMAEFVHFVVEDLFEKGDLDEIRRVFQFLENFFVVGDQETRDLIGIGFFESLQNFASRRAYGNKVFEQFLGPMSKQVWAEIQQVWAGKSSLMDVIRSERQRS